jgi:hypothetical protein
MKLTFYLFLYVPSYYLLVQLVNPLNSPFPKKKKKKKMILSTFGQSLSCMYHLSFSLINNKFLSLSYPRVLVPGGLASHHIASGTLGILTGLFHLNTHTQKDVCVCNGKKFL